MWLERTTETRSMKVPFDPLLDIPGRTKPVDDLHSTAVYRKLRESLMTARAAL